MKATPDNRPRAYCAFCGKAQHEVFVMIAGPTVFICDGCVELCTEIIVARRMSAFQANIGEIEYRSWFEAAS